MKLYPTDILGLAISDRGVSCAQIRVKAGRRCIVRMAHFVTPAELSVDRPEELGAALGAFLRSHGFTARRTAVGVPAKWLFAEEKDVPPSDRQQALAVLRLHAERLAAAHSEELICDIAGLPESGKAGHVLMIAMQRQHVGRISQLCAAANLKAITITPTSIALSQLIGHGRNGPALVLSLHGAEVVWQTGDGPRMLRHISAAESATSDAVATVGTEVRRAVAMSGVDGGTAGDLAISNGWGLTAADLSALSQRLGMAVRPSHTLASLDVQLDAAALNGSADRGAEPFLPAVAIALNATSRATHGVDFLHSRLALPRESRIGRRSRVIAAAVVLAVLLLVGGYMSLIQLEAEAEQLDARLTLMQPDIKAAQARLAQFSYARGYFETRTPVLNAMREVTLALRTDDPIWATNISLRDNGRGQFQGKADNQRIVLTVLDRLKASASFADVQLQDMREVTSPARAVAFSITFTYREGG